MEFASYINDMARRHSKYKFHISPTQENTHNIVVLSPDAFNEILKVQDFRQSIPASLKKRWQDLRGRMELTASYGSSVDGYYNSFFISRTDGSFNKSVL